MIPLIASCVACVVGICTLAGLLMAVGAWKQRHLDLERRHGELAGEVRPAIVKVDTRVTALELGAVRTDANVQNLIAGVDRIEGTVTRTDERLEKIAERLASK